jgi:hypothetical protein
MEVWRQLNIRCLYTRGKKLYIILIRDPGWATLKFCTFWRRRMPFPPPGISIEFLGNLIIAQSLH